MMRNVGVVALLLGCAVAKAAPPIGPGELAVTAGVAPGDTVAYVVSWAAGARATAYDFTTSVTATNGAWTVIYGTTLAGPPPQTGSTTALTFTLKLVAIPWDSATVTVDVWSRNAAGRSSTPASRTWAIKRRPGPPGPILVDSSATITGLRIEPHAVTLVAAAQTEFCAFVKFATGQIVKGSGDPPVCDSLYATTVPAAAKVGITTLQQARADSLCVQWTATGGTLTATPCPIGLRDGLRWQVALR